MSGSNSICVATVILETGILPMTEPVTRLVLEAPGGLIEVAAACRNGKAECIGGQGAKLEECDCLDNDCNGVKDNENPPDEKQLCSPGKTWWDRRGEDVRSL